MPLKECPPGKILNPATNRCVKVDGKIGKALLKAKSTKPPTYKNQKIDFPMT